MRGLRQADKRIMKTDSSTKQQISVDQTTIGKAGTDSFSPMVAAVRFPRINSETRVAGKDGTSLLVLELLQERAQLRALGITKQQSQARTPRCSALCYFSPEVEYRTACPMPEASSRRRLECSLFLNSAPAWNLTEASIEATTSVPKGVTAGASVSGWLKGALQTGSLSEWLRSAYAPVACSATHDENVVDLLRSPEPRTFDCEAVQGGGKFVVISFVSSSLDAVLLSLMGENYLEKGWKSQLDSWWRSVEAYAPHLPYVVADLAIVRHFYYTTFVPQQTAYSFYRITAVCSIIKEKSRKGSHRWRVLSLQSVHPQREAAHLCTARRLLSGIIRLRQAPATPIFQPYSAGPLVQKRLYGEQRGCHDTNNAGSISNLQQERRERRIHSANSPLAENALNTSVGDPTGLASVLRAAVPAYGKAQCQLEVSQEICRDLRRQADLVKRLELFLKGYKKTLKELESIHRAVNTAVTDFFRGTPYEAVLLPLMHYCECMRKTQADLGPAIENAVFGGAEMLRRTRRAEALLNQRDSAAREVSHYTKVGRRSSALGCLLTHEREFC
ncbi:hypothetical protein cyc_03385 [Cyclospora cayetanensis]|uniref:Uncharacterized protein n=1 Tax=Cyclospora cayetanensis TaxID=88456 RepID=A0A1D3D9H4_9EIME|nr:hypothetical protein cyc_03385 [Cyclospora cayetanensis]